VAVLSVLSSVRGSMVLYCRFEVVFEVRCVTVFSSFK
jgi:hypothetical protein